MQKWKILKTDVAFDNKWYRIEKDRVELPSGKIIDDYYINITPNVALVFAVTAHGTVIMVRQYKHGVREILLEFPGGLIDPADESPRIAAERELREETGYACPRFEELGTIYDNPTKDTKKIHLFLARGAEKAHDTVFDITEDIETVEIALADIPRLIKTQEIRVAGSVALYYMAMAALNG